jgi:uncharacterized membrane-anchored protein
MKTLSSVIFICVALIQLSVPASVVWRREQTLRHGRVWKFKTAPVDPIDAVRGRYIALRFAAEKGPREDRIANGAVVYVVLGEDANGFAKVNDVKTSALRGDNVVKATSGGRTDHRVTFPFDRLWVTEQDAAAAENAYLDNSRRGNDNAYVTVRVRDGDAAVEKLYINNQALADYLRGHTR